MGHTRLGTLPKTRKWADVVAIMAADPEMGGDATTSDLAHEVARIAGKVMDAAAGSFERAGSDPGVADSFWLLVRVSLACRSPDPAGALREHGFRLGPHPSPADVVRELTRSLDEESFARARRTDFGEMASASVAAALAEWLRARAAQGHLFSAPEERTWSDLRGLSTQDGFGEVSHAAMGNLVSRLLGFYLSRAVAPGEGLIGGTADLARFEGELDRHSRERARIVREFAGTWFTKHEFREGGITRPKARRFVAYLLKKVATELRAKPAGR